MGRRAEPPGLPPDLVIFGFSAEMQRIRHQLEKVCTADIPILIQGEAGTGKEVLAQWIHSRSPWRPGPFVKVNCAAIPGPLLESELFGYQKGAFTGAVAAKPGRVELAQGGTLFLDEISNLDPLLQANPLQVLQDRRFSRIGDEEQTPLHAPVLPTTNPPTDAPLESAPFRHDFTYTTTASRQH